MSAFYQISYDPKSIMNDALLVDRIKQYGEYCNILPGTWLIYTTDDAKEIYEGYVNQESFLYYTHKEKRSL